jgi:hypothetical protein
METKEPQQRRGDAGVASLVLSIIGLLAFIFILIRLNTSGSVPFVFIVFTGVLALTCPLVGVILGIKGLKKPHRPAIATIGLVLSMVVFGGVAFLFAFFALFLELWHLVWPLH